MIFSKTVFALRCAGVLASCCVLMLSCSTAETKHSSNVFKFEDFKTVELNTHEEIILDNPDIIGAANLIKVVNDSVIAICQNSVSNHVILYNIQNGKSLTVVRRGNGPEEMLHVSTLSVDTCGTLWMSGLMDKKVMAYTWSSADDPDSVRYMFSLPEDFLRGVSDSNGGIIGLPGDTNGVRLMKVSDRGVPLDSFGVFPHAIMPDNLEPRNYTFQADMAYNAGTENLVVANRLWNQIEVYNLGSNKEICIKAPLDADVAIGRQTYADAVSYNPTPLWFIFSNAVAGDSTFAVGYIGVKVEKEADFDRGIGSILEFDWTGTPLHRYVPGSEAIAFDVDFKNSAIYTLENRPEPVVVKYNLKY